MKKLYFIILSSVLLWPTTTMAATLSNPLQTTNLRVVITRLIQAVLGVTGSVALLMFVYGGFLFLISQGKPESVKKGKDTMTWAILGLAVIVGAYAIVSALVIALETGQVG